MSSLSRIGQEVTAEWGVRLGEPFPLARHSFVAAAGDDAVLKVRPAEDDESDEEADALRFWDGDGAIRLYREDRSRRAMLLERARPGTDISVLPEARATEIAVVTGRRLWRPAGAPFRWIGDWVPKWLESAEERGGEIEPASVDAVAELTIDQRRLVTARTRLLERARELLKSLDIGRSTLVHGDFHHHNILDAGGRYVAIDPKPMLGEPEFDVASFLWNPLGSQMSSLVAESRLAAFGAAGLDQARMRAWAVIRGAYLGVGAEKAEALLALERRTA